MLGTEQADSDRLMERLILRSRLHVDRTGDEPRILREGAITTEDIPRHCGICKIDKNPIPFMCFAAAFACMQ